MQIIGTKPRTDHIPQPKAGDIVIATNPPIESDDHRSAPAIVTYADGLIINAHVFQNEAGAVLAIRLPHKEVRGPIITAAYWEWPKKSTVN